MMFKWTSQTFESPSIHGRRVFRLIVPNQYEERIPLLILLHGVYGSEIDWMTYGNLLSQVEELYENQEIGKMGILMPSDGLMGKGTGYLNWEVGYPHLYEDYLLKDLIPYIEKNWKIGGERKLRCISGLSMGGYAALRMGLMYPELFNSISSMSGFFDVFELENLVGTDVFQRIIKKDGNLHNKYSPLETTIKDTHSLPSILFDCGLEDSYLTQNRELHRKLNNLNIGNKFNIFQGGHDWKYWQARIKEHLVFHYKSSIK